MNKPKCTNEQRRVEERPGLDFVEATHTLLRGRGFSW